MQLNETTSSAHSHAIAPERRPVAPASGTPGDNEYHHEQPPFLSDARKDLLESI